MDRIIDNDMCKDNLLLNKASCRFDNSIGKTKLSIIIYTKNNK